MFIHFIKRYDFRYMLPVVCITAVILAGSVFFSCKKTEEERIAGDRDALRQVLYVQSLYNNHPGEDIVPEIRDVIDSMNRAGRNPYYFAAINILIDRLFSEGRFAEADSLTVRMEEEAREDSDSVSIAMARRVRAQIYYKLSHPSQAREQLEPTLAYIANPYRSPSEFGTATSIREWLWIINRDLNDTAAMNRAGVQYAMMVDENHRINNWIDSTGHYKVSALAFRAEDLFSKGDKKGAVELLDSAADMVLPGLPSRAYEHLYEVRARVRGAEGNWDGALADVDTLLKAHKGFPWFYLKDLLLKAEILNMAGRHEESAKACSGYIAFHDSLSHMINDRRLQDLTVLYRSEIDMEHKRTEHFRLLAYGSAIVLLLILSVISVVHAAKVKKRNRILAERLNELDRAGETSHNIDTAHEEMAPIDRLDRYMLVDRPYTNPALSRKELADFLEMSQDALGQLIREEKGSSVRTYINSFRLEEARKILSSASAEGIAELAVKLGFGTARTLQRAFKERYDMSPTQYREASRHFSSHENQ